MQYQYELLLRVTMQQRGCDSNKKALRKSGTKIQIPNECQRTTAAIEAT
jgi:hypothetical protein